MIVDLVLGVAVLGLLVYRQMRTRPVRAFNARLPLILGVIGVVELAAFLKGYHHSQGAVAASLVGSLVLAAVFGAARAATVRIWLREGQAWVKGTWITGVLWVVSLAAHLGYDAVFDVKDAHGSLGSASILLYLAVTFVVQRLVVQRRAQGLGLTGGPGPISGSDATSFS
jgi:hypothetical protein